MTKQFLLCDASAVPESENRKQGSSLIEIDCDHLEEGVLLQEGGWYRKSREIIMKKSLKNRKEGKMQGNRRREGWIAILEKGSNSSSAENSDQGADAERGSTVSVLVRWGLRLGGRSSGGCSGTNNVKLVGVGNVGRGTNDERVLSSLDLLGDSNVGTVGRACAVNGAHVGDIAKRVRGSSHEIDSDGLAASAHRRTTAGPAEIRGGAGLPDSAGGGVVDLEHVSSGESDD